MNAKPIRILQVIGSAKAGGAETFYVRVIKEMAQHASRFDVVPVVRQNSWIAEQLTLAGIRHYALPFGGLFDFSTARQLKGLVKKYQPDVVQSWMNRASRFVRPEKGNHTLYMARLGGYYNLKYYRKMDCLVGNTLDICAYLKKAGWPAERVHYLPNFTPLPKPLDSAIRTQLRSQLKLAQTDFAILVAARLHPNKGLDTAISALAQLPPHCHLVLAGEGEDEAALKAQATSLGISQRLHFLGWVENIEAWAMAADAWAVPSRHEPLGNVVLDAWAHKLPVVAAATAGPVSLIEEGQTGLLVPKDNPQALASALLRLLGDQSLRTKLAERGFKAFESRFSPSVVLQQYYDFYATALHKKRHG